MNFRPFRVTLIGLGETDSDGDFNWRHIGDEPRSALVAQGFRAVEHNAVIGSSLEGAKSFLFFDGGDGWAIVEDIEWIANLVVNRATEPAP